MPTFPSSLPALDTLESFSATFADNVLRTAMEVGPEKRRRRSTVAARPLAVGHRAYSLAQTQALHAFYRDELLGGTLQFEMYDPLTGQMQDMYFAAPPEVRATTWDRFSVSVQLQVLE